MMMARQNNIVLLAILVCFVMATAAAVAFQSSARNSMLKSRDQVADQKRNLERTYADLDRKIAEMQDQKYKVGRYITDCDRTIHDLDHALAAQDSAYRGR
jgi:septal ring factor EnvC (AmiA/AmiB activator)